MIERCCRHMAEHITCHNGCYELVVDYGFCNKCLARRQR
ncbi:hypothetical protein LCGC14_1904480 [marine sediment metagenome]|uniref:Uncharacterized protein n=1 Tax=marine sediment metagenome TaxID=412755 RepID=A0A0F9FVH8_9ZZZZ